MKTIYLNNAFSSYPKPRRVIEDIQEYLNKVPIASYRNSLYESEELIECRQLIADFLSVDNKNQIVFTSGATESINLVLNGLECTGCKVVTTNIEHNSVLRPLFETGRKKNWNVKIVDCDESGFIDPGKIQREISNDTGLVIISHCSNVTGKIQDISSVSRIIKEFKALLIVDISQTIGSQDLSHLVELADILVFTGHKYLYGLPGIGGVYISEKMELNPLKTGGTGVSGDLLHQPNIMPHKFEAGTPNLLGIISMKSGIEFIKTIGFDNIRKKMRRSTSRIINGLKEIKGVKIYGSNELNNKGTVVSFNVNRLHPEDVGFLLHELYHIIVRTGLHCAPLIHKVLGTNPYGTVRVSPSYFTTDDEIDNFLHAINKISAGQY